MDKNNIEIPERFTEGDIFYTFFENQFHLYKLLKIDKVFDTYHVLCYAPLDKLPEPENISELDISIYHSPIDISGFKGAKLLSTNKLTHDDLIGYYEYLRQTQNFKELAQIANNYYKEAYRLTDIGQLTEAIVNYSRAIELIPDFYEAIDNRAFCKMDLAKWKDAIEDFELSLSVNPNSFLAIFSIGECYFKMGDYKNAIVQFEKSIEINPNNALAQDFLKKAIELQEQSK